MTMPIQPLPTGSAFSRAVFKALAQVLTREYWPPENMRGLFVPEPNGAFLHASFDVLSDGAAEKAAMAVRRAGVKLVMASPAAAQALQVYSCTQWRNGAAYALVPLLFAIPLMAGLSDEAVQIATMLFGVDLVALILVHALLMKLQAALGQARFLADLPVPGFRVQEARAAPPLPLEEGE
ncbi:MAG: hypothetical protein HY985_07640 [Magnetospirillum sp.]|nr:hypothetical protein [Magnetospirillum sp.]